MDFCKIRTCDLQLSTLMFYVLSQEAHPASTATCSALRTLSFNQMLPTLVGFEEKFYYILKWIAILHTKYADSDLA